MALNGLAAVATIEGKPVDAVGFYREVELSRLSRTSHTYRLSRSGIARVRE